MVGWQVYTSNGVYWSRSQSPKGYMEFCYDAKTHVGLVIVLLILNFLKVFGKNCELCELHV